MFDDPLSLLSAIIWLAALGTWPVGFLFGACSPCCQQECSWFLEFERCLRIELAGSEPRIGGDCPLDSPNSITTSFLLSTDTQRIDTGFGFNCSLSIANVQSRIKIPVRLNLSAAGSSRTPVGEARTQVWRFNRTEPGSANVGGGPGGTPASSFDVLGPPWHLQVDLFVTGVESQEDTGVFSSLSQDEYGQPKLVLNVNQWEEDIAHDEIVTLFPTGLQRWEYASESFRIGGNGRNATIASGDSHSGWLVSKPIGLTIEERALAVYIGGSVALGGSGFNLPSTCVGGVFLSPTIILDDETAVAFLEGEHEVILDIGPGPFGSPAGERRARILPSSAMCGIPASNLGVGVALGIYPELAYATPSQEFIDFTLAGRGAFGYYCDIAPYVMRPANDSAVLLFAGASDSDIWASSFNYRGAGVSRRWVRVRPDFFYSGTSLMWNAEHGPYRTSGQGGGPVVAGAGDVPSSMWTYSLVGEGDEYFNRPDAGACPDGMTLPTGIDVNIYNVCTPLSIEVQGSYSFQYRPGPGFSNDLVTVTGSMQGALSRARDLNNSAFNFFGQSFRPPADEYFPALFFSGTLEGEQHVLIDWNGNAVSYNAFVSVAAEFEVPCDLDGETPSNGKMIGFFAATFPQNVSVFTSSLDISLEPGPAPFGSRARPSCGEWTIAPAEGGTITRTCENLEGYTEVQPAESATVPPLDSRLPRILGYQVGSPGFQETHAFFGPGPTQVGSCRMVGLGKNPNRVPRLFLSPRLFLTMPAGVCHRYFVLFGNDNPISFRGDSSRLSPVPCGDCTPTIEILSGEDNATVQFLEDTDNAYVVEVQAKRTWRGAEGVTFSVACGEVTVTHEMRRVNTVPTPPRSLTVTRGPCSQAVLQWESPDWDGGSPVTSYTVQLRRIGISSWTTFGTVSPPLLTTTVTGLLRVGYEFRVSATNSVGTSEFSNVAVDGFALGAPSGLVASPRNPCDQVTLSWSPPAQSECIVVKEYRVQAFFVAGEPVIDIPVPGDVTTFTVTGLSPTVARQFRIRREDDAGTFLFSSVITVDGCPPE
jgi:hypothetical protein